MPNPLPYTAIVRGINSLDRVKQNFHRTQWQAEEWAKTVLEANPPTADSPDPYVEIFETRESLVKVVRLKEKKG